MSVRRDKEVSHMQNTQNSGQDCDFDSYRLTVSRPVIKLFIMIASLFNLLLLIPDLINLSGQQAVLVIVVRAVLAVMLAAALLLQKRIRSFLAMSVVVTLLEVIAIAQFLIVFKLYASPDFLIQILGMMILIIVVFLVPNKLLLMLITTVVGSALFLVFASMISIQPAQIIAGGVYLAGAITLCMAFAIYLRGYQRRECIARAQLEYISATDPLTQMGNRNMLEDEGQKWVESLSEKRRPLSLVLMDVDNLKQINDTHGHVVGDGVLQMIAQITRKHLCNHDICVRWGGDEFVLLLPHADPQQARKLMEQIRQAIYGHDFGVDFKPTCCYGIVQQMPGQSLDALIAQADASMYAAKSSGKDVIVVNGGEGIEPNTQS